MDIKKLNKEIGSSTRNPNSSKYYISCQEKITPNTEGWIKIIKSLKIVDDNDKSTVLLSVLDKHTDIIVKISDSNLKKEYEYGELLKKIKGFVKYICFFECNDNFRNYPGKKTDLCKGVGKSMKIIVMPYFKLGSLASYKWDSTNIKLFHTCLKHSLLSILMAFNKLNIIHGDFHPANVVLKETKQKELSYDIPTIGLLEHIPTYGIRTWVMDFENSSIADFSNNYNKMKTLNDFYYDLSKFFTLLKGFIKNLNFITIQPIIHYISAIHIKSNLLTLKNINDILDLIDNIELF